MTTQSIQLTERGQEFVDSMVERGELESPAEVVDAALRQMEQSRRTHDAKVEAFREAAQAGVDDLDNGRYTAVAREDLSSFVAGLSPRLTQGDTPE